MKNASRSAILIRLLFLFQSHLALAQSGDIEKIDQNFFRNPLGIPVSLTANFGELRADHWHMGLDIRTNRKENYRVYAAADGYIAFIG
ncbi:MAG: hypothetical protein HC867_02375, partial [Bacteroidia bacterium]|nr:hypothetical protein [Bacteroidia bacterium]